MRHLVIALAALLSVSAPVSAQDAPVRLEVRTFLGALVPTGDHRDDFKTATTLGMQGAFELTRYVHLVGTAAWSHGHVKYATFDDDLANVWHYDIGAEFNARFDTDLFLVRPFFGFGAGGRSYDYQKAGEPTRSCATGYAAVGSELEVGSVALRAEARDYLNCFQSPISTRKSTRNDVLLSIGFAYHIW